MNIQRIISNHLESNTFVAENNGEAIIIDAGAELSDIKKAVGKNNALGIFLTHGHFDHAYNAIEIAEYFNCKIYAASVAKENLSDPAKNYGENFKIADFSRFHFLPGEDVITLGSFEIHFFPLPGHSKCSLGFLIDNTLFAGDVLFSKGIGRTDLYGGDKNEMLASLKLIQSLEFDTLASGHGDISTAQSQVRNLKTFIRFLSR